jgi:hypothetical protein
MGRVGTLTNCTKLQPAAAALLLSVPLFSQVINDAFDLLVGCDGSQGRPLSALVLLLRGLWEYLHHHGLGRLLAKPLKLLLALRSVMLVSLLLAE